MLLSNINQKIKYGIVKYNKNLHLRPGQKINKLKLALDNVQETYFFPTMRSLKKILS